MKRIQIYDPDDGTLLRSVAVLNKVANELDIAGTNVVYRLGHCILNLDAVTGEKELVAWPQAQPLDVSIEGRRVVWGENGRANGRIVHRIRAVMLPD